jgi:RecA-family ATPase
MTTLQRASLWLSKVPPAISGSGGHNATYTAAVGLVHGFGLSHVDSLTLLEDWNKNCQPPWKATELAYKLREASSRAHNKPRGHLLEAGGSSPSGSFDISRVTFKKPVADAPAPVPVPSLSPVAPDPQASEFRRFMQTAFAPTEVVCICDAVEEGRPVSAGSFITIEEWLNRFDDPQSRILSPEREGIFVRINPFKPNLYSGSDNDVSAFRHVLVEFDDLPKPEQEKRLRDSGLPITVLIDSGGKSIHGWVRVDAPSRKEWDARRDLIYSAIPGIDAKNKNPSRYSRLPGAWRSPTSQQRLLATRLGAASWEDWLTNRETDDDQSTVVTVKDLINFDPTKDPDNLIGKRWLTRGSSMIISGGTGIGKSSMMMQIVIRWALGKDFFGIAPVRPLRIGIVQAENDKGDLAESFRGVVQGLNMGVSDIGTLQENLHFRTESVRTGDQFLAYARRFITRSKLDLIIGDPLFSYFGGDLSDQGEVSVFLRNKLQPILHQTKVAWIWMHHIGKTQRKDGEPLTTMELAHAGFGSSELANWAREIAVLAEVGQSKPRRFQLAFCKRGSRLPANTLNLQHAPSGIVWEKWNPMMMTGAQLKEEKPYQTRKGRRA